MADPVVGSTEEQKKKRAEEMGGNVASGEDWASIRVYTGRYSTRPLYDSDQTGSWMVPGSIDYEVPPSTEYVTRDGKVEEIKKPGKPKLDYESVTAGELASQWFTMDPVERERYKDTFILLGAVTPKGATDMDYSQVWIAYVRQLATYNQATPPGKDGGPGARITVGDLIEADMKRKEATDPGLSELQRTGKRTSTRTSTNLQQSSNLDARALMDAAARALLGRGATDEESGKLLAAVNALEKENPEVTTTTSETDMYGDIVNQSSTTTGGVSSASREQIAREQAEANPEYGAYQAATTYMGSLMDMVYGKGY